MIKIKLLPTIFSIVLLLAVTLSFKANKLTHSPVYCSTLSGTCSFAYFGGYILAGGITTTEPCGAGISYYPTMADNCTINGIAPANTLTLYETNNE